MPTCPSRFKRKLLFTIGVLVFLTRLAVFFIDYAALDAPIALDELDKHCTGLEYSTLFHSDTDTPRFQDIARTLRERCHVRPGTIPNIIHFVWLSEQPHEFSFFEYVSLRLAVQTQRPKAVIYWVSVEPSGLWWERAKPYIQVRKWNTVAEPEIPAASMEHFSQIFNQTLRIDIHMSDAFRLRALIKHGGIYIDSDCFMIRSLESLRTFEFVLGAGLATPHVIDYATNALVRKRQHVADVELANGVLMAAPNSRFVRRWFDKYHNVMLDEWDFGGISAGITWHGHEEEVLVTGPMAFGWPQPILRQELHARGVSMEEFKRLTRQVYLFHLSGSALKFEMGAWKEARTLDAAKKLIQGNDLVARACQFVAEKKGQSVFDTCL